MATLSLAVSVIFWENPTLYTLYSVLGCPRWQYHFTTKLNGASIGNSLFGFLMSSIKKSGSIIGVKVVVCSIAWTMSAKVQWHSSRKPFCVANLRQCTARMDAGKSSNEHYRSMCRKRPPPSKDLTFFSYPVQVKPFLLLCTVVFGFLPSLLIDLQCQPHCRLNLRNLRAFYLDSLSTTLDWLSGLFWFAFSIVCLFYFTLEYSPIRSSVR